MKEFTLRKKIEDAKAEHLRHYGVLDWQWFDEVLIWTIQDYHSSKGSVLDFTEDDKAALEENGWSLEEVRKLCEEDD